MCIESIVGIWFMNKVICLGNFAGKKTQSRCVFDINGISPVICSGHSNTMPYVIVKDERTKKQIKSDRT